MTASYRYPYTMVDGHVVLECEGRRLLLDTGAPVCVGRERVLHFAGAAHPAVDTFSGTGLDEIAAFVGAGLDGILGTDVLAAYDLVIDPARGELRAFASDHDLAGSDIPLDCSGAAPTLGVEVAGRRLTMIFDTGAKLSYLDRRRLDGLPPAGVREDFYPGLGSFTVETFETPVTIGPFTATILVGALPDLPVIGHDPCGNTGILGSAIFDHFAVGYSPRRSKMTLVALRGA